MSWEKETPKTVPIKEIDWNDITGIENWNEEEDVEDTQITSVGYLLEDSDQRVVIARDYSWSDETWSSFVVFPRGGPEVRSPEKQGDDDAGDHE